MSTLTYVSNGNDWEALYVDGEKVADQHLGRLWPSDAFSVIDEYDITETEIRRSAVEPGEPFPSTLSELDDE